MSTIQDTDLFPLRQGGTTYKATAAQLKAGTTGDVVVRRGTTNYRLSAAALATVGDTDILPVGRGGQPYWVSGADLKAYLTPPDPEYSLWTPAEIVTELWFDGADANTFVVDPNGRITAWNDKSGVMDVDGNPRTFLQTLAGRQPLRRSTEKDVFFGDTGPTWVGRSGLAAIGTEITAIFVVHPDWEATGFFDSGAGDANIIRNGPWHDHWEWHNGQIVRMNLPQAAMSQVMFRHSLAQNRRDVDFRRNGEFIGNFPSSPTVGIHWGLTTLGTFNNGQATYNGSMQEAIICPNGAMTEIVTHKIEGYLAHKWGIADQLPTDHPYKDDPPMAGKRWTPANLPGVQAWWDARDLSTLTLSGSNIVEWRDRITGHKFEQTNGARQLTFAGRGFVSGVDQRWMNAPTIPINPSLGVTTFAFTDTSRASMLSCVTFSHSGFYCLQRGASGNWEAEANPGTPRVQIGRPANAESAITWQMVPGQMHQYTATNSTGTLTATNRVLTGLADNYQPVSLNATIPTGETWGAIQGTVDYRQIVWIDGAITEADRQRLEGWVMHYYGRSASLPADHPYKDEPPVL